ncbi:MAG: radical SAM protein, partial [Candidatus Omnitrophota bacterium]
RKLDIVWVCMSRAGFVDQEMLMLMRKTGCREISLGLESGDETVLKRMHKQITLEQAKESVCLIKKAGIRTHASFILGNLGETEESIRRTINFAKELNTDIVAFFITSPFPGTELYEDALRYGYIRKGANWRDFSPLSKTKPVMNLPNLSSDVLMKWHRRAIQEYYLRPAYIIKKILNLRSKVDFLNLYDGFCLFMRIKYSK